MLLQRPDATHDGRRHALCPGCHAGDFTLGSHGDEGLTEALSLSMKLAPAGETCKGLTSMNAVIF